MLRGMLHSYYEPTIFSSRTVTSSDSQRQAGSPGASPSPRLWHVLQHGSPRLRIPLPRVIDIHNLSYKTVRCPHPECRNNLVPGLDYHICRKRRGIYSAILAPTRTTPHTSNQSARHYLRHAAGRIARGASLALKLLLNASYGVTIQHGLAAPY